MGSNAGDRTKTLVREVTIAVVAAVAGAVAGVVAAASANEFLDDIINSIPYIGESFVIDAEKAAIDGGSNEYAFYYVGAEVRTDVHKLSFCVQEPEDRALNILDHFRPRGGNIECDRGSSSSCALECKGKAVKGELLDFEFLASSSLDSLSLLIIADGINMNQEEIEVKDISAQVKKHFEQQKCLNELPTKTNFTYPPCELDR